MNTTSWISYTRLKTDAIANLIEAQYHLSDNINVASLNYGFNDIYHITTSDSHYIFRLTPCHKYWDYTQASYQTEIDLLLYLKPLAVTHLPIRQISNDYLGTIALPEGERYYSLFTYAPGSPIDYLDSTHARSFGKMLARLHEKMTQFSHTVSHVNRFRHDMQTLYHRPINLAKSYGLLQEDIEYLNSLEDKLIPKIEEISITDDTFGLIHGDYQVRNIHYD